MFDTMNKLNKKHYSIEMQVMLSEFHEHTSDWPWKDASSSFTEGSLGSTPGSC
jgi:ribosome-associated toxin RatA of RatAB toxin-antitoxin module